MRGGAAQDDGAGRPTLASREANQSVLTHLHDGDEKGGRRGREGGEKEERRGGKRREIGGEREEMSEESGK